MTSHARPALAQGLSGAVLFIVLVAVIVVARARS
jgi:hypothetical protein